MRPARRRQAGADSQVLENLNLLAEHELLKRYVVIEDEDTRYGLILNHLLTVFRNLQKALPDYYEIRFVLPDGYEDAYWVADGIENLSEEVNGQPWFENMQASGEDQFQTLPKTLKSNI